MATKNKTSSKPSLRGTKQSVILEHESSKQSHDATVNNKQIALAKKPRNEVPKLRFNEFEGEWEQKKLGAVTEMTSSKRVYLSDYVNNGVPFYRGKEISELRLNKTPSDILYITRERYEDFKKKYGVPLKDDILITAVGTLGNVLRIRNDDEFYFKDGNLIWLKNIKVDSVFLETLIQWKNNDLLKTSIGSTQKALTMVELRKLKFTFPKLPEQQKITCFLTAVDTKQQQLTTKKEKLSQYKKGVMQQLFSQQLRFKPDVIASALDEAISQNETEFPDWEEKKLGEVLKYYDGTHQTPKYVEEGIPFYSVEHVTANQFSKTKFITKEVFEKENKRVKLEKGDILMTRIGDIGTSRLIDWKVNASFYVSLALLKQNVSFNSTYLNQYISSTLFQNELWKRTIHVAFPKKINLGEIGNCKVKLPSLKEQQKIANYLSAIDAKIASVQKQITNTQQFKKGLLQQLFV